MATLAVDEKKVLNEKQGAGQEAPVSTYTSDSNESTDGELEKGIPEYGSYPDHVFANEDVANYWRAVYEKSRYEGRHQFDPKLEWSAAEEKRIRRKVRQSEVHNHFILVMCSAESYNSNVVQIDFRIITWAWMMFMALDLNRRNINRGAYKNVIESPRLKRD